jgi:hypothetical protein
VGRVAADIVTRRRPAQGPERVELLPTLAPGDTIRRV